MAHSSELFCFVLNTSLVFVADRRNLQQSSITLVGELLFKVSGISGKAEIGEDEEVAEPTTADSSRRALVEVLGAERRDRILSALYLARQDAVNVVRTSSIHIWKALVSNTPRTGTSINQSFFPHHN